MDMPINVSVWCGEHDCGRSTYIVLNPKTREITHIVVREKDLSLGERLVPVDMVIESTPTFIRLRCSKEELARQQRFTETEFLGVDAPHSAGGSILMWPYAYPVMPLIPLEHEQIPAGELALRRGTAVEASDGRVGRIDEFLVDPTSDYITHLIMREGHLWGQKDVSIPVSQIDRIEEDVVYLKLNKQEIAALPTIPIRYR
jgi:sporulation protein YlmC with PRC-barrel domain